MTTFADFALLPPLNRALAAEGYTTPTPIQAQTIPFALEGRDVLGIAQTGTGKTCAFALPILQRLGKSGTTRKPRTCRALILSPTRELASQIADSFRAYGKFMHLSIDVVFGGVPIARQIKSLATGADVLVATPGRLLDLIDQKAISLRDLEILVLDEADQMLDLGFIHALRRIVTLLPKQRQSLFFSATMPKSIGELADSYLKDPAKVSVAPVATTAERVDQGVIFVPQAAKQELLYQVLTSQKVERVLVFTRMKHGADRVVKQLVKDGIEAAAIHGNKSQAQRERALAAFRAGTCKVLVATDIAARGIDVDGVTHVINFELPNVPDQYVHRIGRTARAGASGIAIAFCAPDERPYLRDIERLTRMNVPVMPLPEGFNIEAAKIREVEDKPRPQQSRGGRPGSQRHGGQPGGNRPQGHGHRNGAPRGEGRGEDARPQQGRPAQGRPQQPRSQEARAQEGRTFEGRNHEGRNHEARGGHGAPQGHHHPRDDAARSRPRRRRFGNGKPQNRQAEG